MTQIVWCANWAEVEASAPLVTGAARIDEASIRLHRPDLHGMILDGDNLKSACSLWWTVVPHLSGQRLGVIGHFNVASGAENEAAAKELLQAACAQLKAHGCTLAVGPMDGSTWRKYRFLTESFDDYPPFLFEPTNPASWPGVWQSVGFAPLAEYASAVAHDLSYGTGRAVNRQKRLLDKGLAIQRIDPAQIESQLEQVYQLACQSFAQNFLYIDGNREEFIGQMRAVLPQMPPEFLEFVVDREQNNKMVGFIFTYPDFHQRLRGETIDTAILKTVAIDAHPRYAGLGAVLVDRSHQIARDLGYKSLVHALMNFENAKAMNLSLRYGKLMRKYQLYSRTL